MNRKPPIHCTPTRLHFNGERYRIYADGSVSHALTIEEIEKMGFVRLKDVQEYERTTLTRLDPYSSEARLVRREAARLRRNRNNRERHAAMKDLGLTKTKYGWE